MCQVEQQILAALAEVASCRYGHHAGCDIDPVVHAILVLATYGPADVPVDKLVRLVLDVRWGRLSSRGALARLFSGDYAN